ncbi:MAG: hypothetical protein KAS78_02955 [Candidatus Pacebacteria bacterium]|nr:hypothetical protein [Candidatus Paceibacterota bacterium]
MKKITYIIFSTIALIVFILFLPKILDLFTKDIDPIDDSDLSLQVISISNEENAYFDLIKIKDVIYEPEDKSKAIFDLVNNELWDEKLAEDIIFNNQKAFEYFSKAADKKKFQNPISANPENINPNTIFPSMHSWRKMAQFSSIKALYLLKQDKSKEAIQEALNSVYIGQKMQESQVSFLEYLVAISIKRTGLETVQNVISLSNLSTEELKKYAYDMDQFYKNENGFVAILKGEYYMQSLSIDALVNGDTEMLKDYTAEQSQDISEKLNNDYNYYFRPNKTKFLFAEYVRKTIKNANRFCNDIPTIDSQRLASSSYIKLYLTENAIGKTIYDIVITSLASVNTTKCEEDSLVSATQAIIAIKAYKNDNGDYPSSLDELVPRYISSVPLDYFDGNSLKYSKEDEILYSVGKDLIDNGGSAGESWQTMPDPTFKIEF